MGKEQKTIAILPGMFDPITCGHVDLIRRSVRLFDELIIAIGSNPEKAALFSLQERRSLTERVLEESNLPARVETYQGLTMDFAREVGASVMVRGIRNTADVQFEIQLALTHRAVSDLETVFILTDEEHAFTSSSLIKQIAAGGKVDRLTRLLPQTVIDVLRIKMQDHPIKPHDVKEH